jgi:hypothetical protein
MTIRSAPQLSASSLIFNVLSSLSWNLDTALLTTSFAASRIPCPGLNTHDDGKVRHGYDFYVTVRWPRTFNDLVYSGITVSRSINC